MLSFMLCFLPILAVIKFQRPELVEEQSADVIPFRGSEPVDHLNRDAVHEEPCGVVEAFRNRAGIAARAHDARDGRVNKCAVCGRVLKLVFVVDKAEQARLFLNEAHEAERIAQKQRFLPLARDVILLYLPAFRNQSRAPVPA